SACIRFSIQRVARSVSASLFCSFLGDSATSEIYTLSLHDALPIYEEDLLRDRIGLTIVNDVTSILREGRPVGQFWGYKEDGYNRSEEHTSELQSRENLVCRLLLEKKKKHGQKQNEEHSTDYLQLAQ